MLEANQTGYFPYTPATNLLYGLREALQMLQEEGLENVFARHARHGEATRRAVRAWGLEILCADPRGIQQLADGGDGAGGPRCRPRAASDPRTLRHVARHGAGQAAGQGLPHRPSRVISTISCWRARCAAWRWACSSPACRSAKAACRPRWRVWLALAQHSHPRGLLRSPQGASSVSSIAAPPLPVAARCRRSRTASHCAPAGGTSTISNALPERSSSRSVAYKS